ncbi:right-handed parallel beta-helix repeat-containing protein [Microbacterium sp. JZ37]|uniref:right-handed parallel beta-helix repeat-containing protein n=1 Tax=Microbacterium sp. JZ37 TaxID=2654193 RepID=UPI002B46E1BC|nr:right-handed parallel beta-helix repeat-containing protein [Microbacterium sp. JZ37]WRH16099.1 plasmid stabilization protein [Microbacterium sp. JZ37]
MCPRARVSVLARTLAILAIALSATGCTTTSAQPEEPVLQELVRVPEDAATISEGVDLVAPGGMVLIAPGTYAEEVTVDKDDVTLRGEDRNETIIDGGGTNSFGVFVPADGVRVENLTVHSTQFYGVLVTGMHDENGPLAHGGPGYTELDPERFPPVERFSIDHVTAYNNGLYGIYAFNARHGAITDSYASGSADSGFYVGQCEDCDILVAGNVAERNAIGFENANASDSLTIAGNRFSGNRIGMTLISNYQEAFTPQRENAVFGNLIVDNANGESPAHALGGFGVGLAVNGGQRNVISANRIEGNPTAGILLSNSEDIPAEDNAFSDNAVSGNGVDAVDTSAERALGRGNCFDGAGPATSAPEELRATSCPSDTVAPGGGTTPDVEVPRGMSFLQIPAPPAQPGLDDVETPPQPLPAAVDMPAASEHPLPERTLLEDRAAVR